LEIDLAARTVYREGEEVHLTPIEFKLLGVLVRNRGRLLTYSALLRQVWGAAHEDDRQTLRTHIANLRRKLELPRGRHSLAPTTESATGLGTSGPGARHKHHRPFAARNRSAS
jgi:two-component system, OmpR family, KDP operon response regulator KdpE